MLDICNDFARARHTRMLYGLSDAVSITHVSEEQMSRIVGGLQRPRIRRLCPLALKQVWQALSRARLRLRLVARRQVLARRHRPACAAASSSVHLHALGRLLAAMYVHQTYSLLPWRCVPLAAHTSWTSPHPRPSPDSLGRSRLVRARQEASFPCSLNFAGRQPFLSHQSRDSIRLFGLSMPLRWSAPTRGRE